MSAVQSPYLKHWPKNIGAKPSQKALKQAHSVARPGSKDAIAVAMVLRPQGATQQQIIQVLGGPHRNKIRQLVDRNLAKVVKMPEKEGLHVYKIDLK